MTASPLKKKKERKKKIQTQKGSKECLSIIIIIIDNFCIVLFSDVHNLTALYNTLQHFLNEKKIIKGNNVHEISTYIELTMHII